METQNENEILTKQQVINFFKKEKEKQPTTSLIYSVLEILETNFKQTTFETNKGVLHTAYFNNFIKPSLQKIEAQKDIDSLPAMEYLNELANHLEIKLEDIQVKSRRKEIIIQRFVLFYALKYFYKGGISFKRIGALINKNSPYDHSTVINGVNQFQNLIDTKDATALYFLGELNSFAEKMKQKEFLQQVSPN